MPSAAPWFARRPVRLGVRLLLSVVALALIFVPVLVALSLHEDSLEVAAQNALAPASVSPHEASRWRAAGLALPSVAAPVVLAYHDIRPPRTNGASADAGARVRRCYTITPDAFDRQLAMLGDAGYRSISAAQYIGFLRGEAVPGRSVLITFDGSKQGQWTYADQILARHHMRAVSFLAAPAIGTHWSRYLSWAEIEHMQSSGRWDFGSAVSRTALATLDNVGYRRIAANLRESIESFGRHDLPVPRLLSLPLVDPSWSPNAPQAMTAAPVVRPPFVAGFASAEDQAPTTSRRAAAGKVLGRIEVARNITADQLLATVASVTSIPVSQARPLASPRAWNADTTDAAPVATSGRTLRLIAGGEDETVTYAEDATADWDNYAVTATVQHLTRSRGNSASVLVRVGSTHPLAVRLDARSVEVTATHGLRTTVLRRSALFPSSHHDVGVQVTTRATFITVDHLVTFALPEASGAGAAGTGGIGLSARRASVHHAWPSFANLTVLPATAVSAQASPVGAKTLLANPRLWVQNRLAPAVVRATTGTLQFTGPRLRGFAEYAPAQTSHWGGYTFSATVHGLAAGVSADLYVRVGSQGETIAVVGQHQAKVVVRTGSRRTLAATARVSPSSVHRVALAVRAHDTLVTIDGITVASVPARARDLGGVALAARRRSGHAWPRLVDLKVAGR